jgi:hypothetical protein
MSRDRGRKKLMLKVPEVRHVLALPASETLSELFESYDLALSALERFRAASPADKALILEYERLCSDIEEEVVLYCNGRTGKHMRC